MPLQLFASLVFPSMVIQYAYILSHTKHSSRNCYYLALSLSPSFTLSRVCFENLLRSSAASSKSLDCSLSQLSPICLPFIFHCCFRWFSWNFHCCVLLGGLVIMVKCIKLLPIHCNYAKYYYDSHSNAMHSRQIYHPLWDVSFESLFAKQRFLIHFRYRFNHKL